jgi:hypothetical protein
VGRFLEHWRRQALYNTRITFRQAHPMRGLYLRGHFFV